MIQDYDNFLGIEATLPFEITSFLGGVKRPIDELCTSNEFPKLDTLDEHEIVMQ